MEQKKKPHPLVADIASLVTTGNALREKSIFKAVATFESVSPLSGAACQGIECVLTFGTLDAVNIRTQ